MIYDSKPFRLVALDEDYPSAEQEYERGIQEERSRVLGLFDLVFGRLLKAKWKGSREELERLRVEIEFGHQQIPGTQL